MMPSSAKSTSAASTSATSTAEQGLDRPLRPIVGPLAQALAGREIRTAGQFLDFLPTRYLDPSRPTDFSTLQEGEQVVLLATVQEATTRPMRNRRGRMLHVVVADGDGRTLELTFFRPYGHEQKLVPPRQILAAGTVGRYRDRWQLTHPEYQVLEGGQEAPAGFSSGMIPVYRNVPKAGHMRIASGIELTLHECADVPDPLPQEIRSAHQLPGLMEAYRMIHQPTSWAQVTLAKRRLAWDEAFVIQASLARTRQSADAIPATPRPHREDGLAARFRGQLAFDLTSGQDDVLHQLRSDLDRDRPMHRLLQGDVGTGKTIVALLAMLDVVDNGGQAALLAPTEVLAAQHHRSITAMLGPLAQAGTLQGADQATRVCLLTGSQSAAQRRENLLQAASGEAGIVIGTHALIQEHVQFADLGMVVVDEQHRFGVEQRDALRAKAQQAPHVLVMTATPIPRTVAMTVFGDMETATLRELPAGRQPITTYVVAGEKPAWVQRTWQRVAEEVAAGGQVYVVCSRIGDKDADAGARGNDGAGSPAQGTEPSEPVAPGGALPTPPAEADQPEPARELYGVEQVAQGLRELPATAGLRIEMVHGRLPTDVKDDVMQRFAAGEIDVLVATTVVEVGVDVANATAMVIIDADRFGISQLHQLRGRVGRGGKPGLCLLMTQGTDESAPERLHALAQTTDGFELARLDLELRREGDVLGAAQSGGKSGLRHLRLTEHEDLIEQAHEAAWELLARDPELVDNPEVAQALARLDAERAAYLERG